MHSIGQFLERRCSCFFFVRSMDFFFFINSFFFSGRWRNCQFRSILVCSCNLDHTLGSTECHHWVSWYGRRPSAAPMEHKQGSWSDFDMDQEKKKKEKTGYASEFLQQFIFRNGRSIQKKKEHTSACGEWGLMRNRCYGVVLGANIFTQTCKRVYVSLTNRLCLFCMNYSAVLASFFLHERLGTVGKVGCALCLIGSVVIVLHSPEEKEISSVDEILNYALQPGKPEEYPVLFLLHTISKCSSIGLDQRNIQRNVTGYLAVMPEKEKKRLGIP